MVWISEGIACGLLMWLSIVDIKTEKVPMFGLLSFFLLGLIRLLLLEQDLFFIQCLISIWACLGLWLAGRASGRGIGGGDLWLLTAMPFWRTGAAFLWTLLVSFLSAATYGLLRYGIKERKKRFPFVPWITLGYCSVGMVMIWKGWLKT